MKRHGVFSIYVLNKFFSMLIAGYVPLVDIYALGCMIYEPRVLYSSVNTLQRALNPSELVARIDTRILLHIEPRIANANELCAIWTFMIPLDDRFWEASEGQRAMHESVRCRSSARTKYDTLLRASCDLMCVTIGEQTDSCS